MLVLFGAWHAGTWKCSGFPTWTLSEPLPFGFLWRLHYLGMLDYIIGHWQLLIQPPAFLLSPEVRWVGLKVPTLQSHVSSPWQPAPILGAVQKSPH